MKISEAASDLLVVLPGNGTILKFLPCTLSLFVQPDWL